MADNNTSKASRERKVNCTFTESNLVSELLTEQLNLVKGKHSMEVTNIKKQEMWEDVTRRVNAIGVCLRTEAEVKKVEKYVKRAERNVHTRMKRKVNDREWSCTTETTQAEDNIINAASFKGIDGGLESGFIEIQESHCLEESGSADQTDLDLTLSANERAFQKALDRYI